MNGLHAIYRSTAGAILLLLLTGTSTLNLFREGIRTYSALPPKDPVTILEESILPLKPVLPAAGAVGYVTSVENERIFAAEKAFANVEFLGQYVLTQYTLAPLIVRNSPDYPLVVGNFIGGPPAAEFLEKHRLVPLKDFGGGLILYRRGPAP